MAKAQHDIRKFEERRCHGDELRIGRQTDFFKRKQQKPPFELAVGDVREGCFMYPLKEKLRV